MERSPARTDVEPDHESIVDLATGNVERRGRGDSVTYEVVEAALENSRLSGQANDLSGVVVSIDAEQHRAAFPVRKCHDGLEDLALGVGAVLGQVPLVLQVCRLALRGQRRDLGDRVLGGLELHIRPLLAAQPVDRAVVDPVRLVLEPQPRIVPKARAQREGDLSAPLDDSLQPILRAVQLQPAPASRPAIHPHVQRGGSHHHSPDPSPPVDDAQGYLAEGRLGCSPLNPLVVEEGTVGSGEAREGRPLAADHVATGGLICPSPADSVTVRDGQGNSIPPYVWRLGCRNHWALSDSVSVAVHSPTFSSWISPAVRSAATPLPVISVATKVHSRYVHRLGSQPSGLGPTMICPERRGATPSSSAPRSARTHALRRCLVIEARSSAIVVTPVSTADEPYRDPVGHPVTVVAIPRPAN